MAKAKHRTFVKTIDGTEYTQVAHTPADAVALTFNGWQERVDEPKAAAEPTAATKKTTAASKSSGSK